MDIKDYGWDEYFEKKFMSHQVNGLIPARVVMRNRDNYKLLCDNGTISAKLSGKYKYSSALDGTVPVVGDWVAIQIKESMSEAMIQAIVTRKTCFSRKPAISGGKKPRMVLYKVVQPLSRYLLQILIQFLLSVALMAILISTALKDILL